MAPYQGSGLGIQPFFGPLCISVQCGPPQLADAVEAETLINGRDFRGYSGPAAVESGPGTTLPHSPCFFSLPSQWEERHLTHATQRLPSKGQHRSAQPCARMDFARVSFSIAFVAHFVPAVATSPQ